LRGSDVLANPAYHNSRLCACRLCGARNARFTLARDHERITRLYLGGNLRDVHLHRVIKEYHRIPTGLVARNGTDIFAIARSARGGGVCSYLAADGAL